MKILGISDGMTGGTALIEDGVIVYAVHEERLIREKMATGFPRQSIDRVLEDTGTRPEEIDAIAIATINEFFKEPAEAYDGWLKSEQTPLKELMLNVGSSVTRVVGANALFKATYYKLKGMLGGRRKKEITQRLRDDWGFTCPIEFINHHFAHAASTYYTSGLKDATVITLDGAGDNCCSHVYEVRDGQFRILHTIDSIDSVGNYYSYVTHLCGFTAQRHEGKITGLAAFGKPDYQDILRKFIAYEDGSTVNKGMVFYHAAVKAMAKALPDPFDKAVLASSMQAILEEVACQYVGHWVDRTGIGDLALAGGICANVKMNQRLHKLDNVDSIFIHPGMGDEGLAVGAGFALSARLGRSAGKPIRATEIQDVYLGPDYTNEEIKLAIDASEFEAEYFDNIEEKAARIIADGGVVARFNGRMEYGPRALGNRSVLYQPTEPSVNKWLNDRLGRTEFMPFAPVTLAEYADKCYLGVDGARYPAHFMTVTFDCTEWMKDTCPAVVHIDGTARPQLITREANPSYYKIVDEYRKISGLPSVVNTSFNMHEEPIVCSPSDAIRAFSDGRLDYLAIGNYLLEHPERTASG